MSRKLPMKKLMIKVIEFTIAELREHNECYQWVTPPDVLALLAQVSTARHDKLLDIVTQLESHAARHTKR